MNDKITEANFTEKDELFCNFYKCEKCKYEYIIEKDNFCGGCGSKLKINKIG